MNFILRLLLIGIIVAWAGTPAHAFQEPKTELLWPAGAPGATGSEDKDKPKLILYLASEKDANGAAVVICPGGGYGGLAMGHEGHEIAKWFNEQGVSAFICDYRHRGKGYGHPAPMQDAQRAIRMVRSRAKEFQIDANRIGVIGFSAGGHLASTVATHFDAGNSQDTDPIQQASSRPDFAILCYPVIAFGEPFTHHGSQQNLLGREPDAELVKKLSNEKQVTKDNPPTFLWHTADDAVVLVENSIQFFNALHAVKVPAELHVYEKGRHGLGLAKDVPGAENWPNELIAWLKQREILKKN
ncbi:MAG: alpha/beta hydrolase [Pirellulaceae bacterium]